jgi:hypothetical protein
VTIEIINRFNGGNGGASIVISRETGRTGGMGGIDETEEVSEFVSASRAKEIALHLLRNSVHDDTFKAIKKLVEDDVPYGRVILTDVKGPV